MATNGPQWFRSFLLFVAVLGALAVRGCATLTNAGGCSPDGRIARINNRRLQATCAGVGIGETELVRATHIRFVVVAVAAGEIRGRGDA